MKASWFFALILMLVVPTAHVSADEARRTLIQNRGSDSMAIAVAGWAEQYRHKNKTTGLSVSGGGTGNRGCEELSGLDTER
jgi:ABC-type phosphate transport system substrate-binding protein